jgi:carboxymethylenebutenolidase
VPNMMGGFGGQGVRRFYSEHFINQIPKDAKVTPISRTIGKDQVVVEMIVSFTHTHNGTTCYREFRRPVSEWNFRTCW